MWSRSHGTAVNCTRWVSSCMPPRAGSRAVDAHLALGRHDVRRDEQQRRAAAGREVVLPEHLAGHEREEGADLGAGDLAAERRGGRVGRAGRAAPATLSKTGSSMERIEPTLAAIQPAGRRRAPARTRAGDEPGGLGDRLVGQLRRLVQVGDDVGGLLRAHPRAGPAQAPGHGHGESQSTSDGRGRSASPEWDGSDSAGSDMVLPSRSAAAALVSIATNRSNAPARGRRSPWALRRHARR